MTTAVTGVMDMVGNVLTTVTTNPVLAFIFAGTVIIPVAIRIYKKVRR